MEQSQHNRTQWTSQRRRAFIEHRLYWVGQLGLPDLMGAFDLSRAQASKEINAYKRDHPDNIVYDPHAKTYAMGTMFIPQYETPDASLYLNDLMGISRGACIQNAERYALIPDVFSPPIPSRGVKPETLRPILRAIDAKKRLKITYQSMSADEPKERSISPHALCFDGFRWHCRAFCFSADGFRDFVISRILEVQPLDDDGVDPSSDLDWCMSIMLEVGPHPDLSNAQRRAVELDYEMTGGRAQLEVRKSMLFYTLKRLGLDTPANARPAHQQHIILTGPSELLEQMRGTT
ncbi:WYL domain-containing protein [Paracoccus alcaliphilus]|nr:WYL domain-containing protein [Paracoccus alcaliphilus]